MHRSTRLWAASGALALGLLLGGCAMTPAEEPMPSDKIPPVHPTVLPGAPPTGTTVPPTVPVPDDVLELPGVREAIEAEAQRTGVAPEAVEVAGHASVTWSDGSIGCPQPGMMYTQALVPGRHLVLRVGDELASYHAGGDAAFGYCANPIPPLPA